MSVSDVIAALVPFESALLALFGVSVAVYLVSALVGWFRGIAGGVL